MIHTTAHSDAPVARLTHLPLPLFAAPMGFGGLGLAWREAARVIGAPAAIGEALLFAAMAIWVLVAVLHLTRMIRHPQALAGDLRHPVRSAFAGAISIGLMLISGGLIPYSPDLAAGVWIVAVVLHVSIGVLLLRTMLRAPREAAALTPPLLIPLVGNIVAPIFGAKLGFDTASWALFGIGIVLWASVQPLLFGRIFNGPPLPERLRPTLVIFLAPPSVASVALSQLTGDYGPVALAFLGYATFLVLIYVAMLRDLASVPFAMSWWGMTFPTATYIVAALSAAHAYPAAWNAPVLWIALLAGSLILAIVSARTLKTAFDGELLRPE